MRNFLVTVGLTTIALAAPVIAQNTGAGAGTMSANDVGAAPMTGTAPQSYADWAADGDLYEIQSSRLALTKASSDAVKAHAREMITDHTATSKALMAALPNTNPETTKPPMKLSAANAGLIEQLRQAPSDGFDSLYLQQQMQAHQKAWSLHKGYAADGSDPALRQVANSAVPIVERHLQHLKSMPAGGTSGL